LFWNNEHTEKLSLYKEGTIDNTNLPGEATLNT